jgi:hypothetical protein
LKNITRPVMSKYLCGVPLIKGNHRNPGQFPFHFLTLRTTPLPRISVDLFGVQLSALLRVIVLYMYERGLTQA